MMCKVSVDKNFKKDHFIRYRISNQDMTYILGARCADGVVLVGDQKILRGNIPSYKEKLLRILPTVIIGGAGTSGLIERFSDEIKLQVDNQKITNDAQLLQFVEDRSLQISQTYTPRVGGLEILIGLRAGTNNSQLFNIITQRGFAEPVKECIAIGSGEPYGSLLLQKLWHKDMSMIEFAKIGYLLIKYIIDLKLDDSVGGEPDIWFIPDILMPVSSQQELETKYPVRKANDEEIEEMKKFSNEKLSRIKQFLADLLKEKPIPSASK